MPEQDWKVEREKKLSDALDTLIKKVFGYGGSCGCDGAFDFGCPICTPERRSLFEAEVKASIDKYR